MGEIDKKTASDLSIQTYTDAAGYSVDRDYMMVPTSFASMRSASAVISEREAPDLNIS